MYQDSWQIKSQVWLTKTKQTKKKKKEQRKKHHQRERNNASYTKGDTKHGANKNKWQAQNSQQEEEKCFAW